LREARDGKPVSRPDLKPGDLVFYHQDLHHMGIYVGGNTIVHAPHTPVITCGWHRWI
jgi:cell wall-associated NlpC family hydrolase